MDPKIFRTSIQDTILDSITEGVFTVDLEWRITTFNKAAERIAGIARDRVIGERCSDVFHASICESDCAIRRTLETGQPVEQKGIYIVDFSGHRVPVSISTSLLKDSQGTVIGAVETFRDLSTEEELRQELEGTHSYHDIVSKSRDMARIFDVLPTVAESDSTVLIEGETGTGKELIARAIHDLSRRKDKKLVTLNCGALPDNLLESELFGYKAGAFTDAKKDKPGRLALAEGGTLFLDEIADVSPALQSKLLRALEEHTYEPLGSTESVAADVRVITAHNKNLEELVQAGRFREDLFYRINVLRIQLPPLRDRREDIPLLIDHFIARFSRLKDKVISGVSPDALAILLSYDYPGNIRELQNIVEHAFVLCQSTMIGLRDLPDHLRTGRAGEETPSSSINDLERQFIIEVLRKHRWNRTRTATELGINKSTLWRKMKRLGIERPSH